jgi:hypothetical protein
MATSLANHVRIREAAFEADPLGQIVVDAGRVLVLAHERARGMFGISIRDVSRSLQDLDISYKPVELRSMIDQAISQRRTIVNEGRGVDYVFGGAAVPRCAGHSAAGCHHRRPRR